MTRKARADTRVLSRFRVRNRGRHAQGITQVQSTTQKIQDSSPYSSWHGWCKSYRAGHDEGSNNRHRKVHQCRNDDLPRLVWLRPGAFGGAQERWLGQQGPLSTATSKDSLPSSACYGRNAQNVGHHKGSNSRHRTTHHAGTTPCLDMLSPGEVPWGTQGSKLKSRCTMRRHVTEMNLGRLQRPVWITAGKDQLRKTKLSARDERGHPEVPYYMRCSTVCNEMHAALLVAQTNLFLSPGLRTRVTPRPRASSAPDCCGANESLSLSFFLSAGHRGRMFATLRPLARPPTLCVIVSLSLSLSLLGIGTGQRPRAQRPTQSYVGSRGVKNEGSTSKAKARLRLE